MSDIGITVQRIAEVQPHPNADRLEIVKILGTQCVVPKGEYLRDQKVFYFPPDMMIPEEEAEALGVKGYLKHVWWNGKKVQSRIAACRLRGEVSYGFPAPCKGYGLTVGRDVTENYAAEQYVAPPLKITLPGMKNVANGGLEEGLLHRYTNIQHFWKYSKVFRDDEQVVVTEKIHGTNSRVGVLFEDGEWVYAAGSHKRRWKDIPGAERYWNPIRDAGMLMMLADLCEECLGDVIVFGEVFGSSIQDMDYGVEGDAGYRVYDISVNGSYLNWPDVKAACQTHGVLTVPLLYQGPWRIIKDVIDEYVSGPTTLGEHTRKFKGREGIVIKTAIERNVTSNSGDRLNTRAILKYVSADYLDRKGAQDNA
jgi:RNA ligase (TIGR02306 family)